ncbi:hypothetical protein K502DRAFT_368428 [Neoconidiobolus thromboides FSU 785]|nr:hypothetical protein K502DRAFT_368428 [Neoconidiobolus thromboides FSU 785]
MNCNPPTQTQNLTPYFCVCGAFCLALDRKLDSLPQRKIENSYIIDTEKVNFESKFELGQQIALKRDEGIELQFRYQCDNCGLWIGYHCDIELKKKEEPKFIYLYKDGWFVGF